MADLMSAAGLTPNLLAPAATTTAGELARANAKDVAQKFEAQFLSSMFQSMFAGLKSDGPFGGGEGEEMFRSLQTEAMAKQVAKRGGIGVADVVQREILKMQGLT
ncbi:rod-binding protein [uncultured Phenylobacterium sp.]|uniref:rod-binding protein n=1 Tax=uncultured Phenylobacterium sp. TaxID=349273 RepID=UPI0025EE06AF|nr:rod-binding protein [uncultured Phenylobacterium sp.]